MIYDVNNLDRKTIELGRRGENLASTIRIDVSDWLSMWPDASVSIVVRRPGENEAYIAHTSVADSILSWPVTSADTAIEGYGSFEIRAIAGDVIKKSVTVSTKVCACISCTGDPEPPEGCKDWVNDVLNAADRAEDAVKRAEEIAASIPDGGGTGGVVFDTDETLTLENGVLSVNTADVVEQDNTLPVTSAAVFVTVGNIDALLGTI